MYYRSDWLDALGLSEPTNVQEMNDMLVKFAEYGPTVNGGKDTAGLGSTSSVLNTNFALAAYFQAYGAYPNKWIMRDWRARQRYRSGRDGRCSERPERPV